MPVLGSIYDQIGGMAAVGATVDELYARVLGDPKLAPFFEGLDMERQRSHMRTFIAAALGSTRAYEGRDMAEAARRAGHHRARLRRGGEPPGRRARSLGVPTEQVQAVLARIAPLRDEIVC